MAAIVSLHLAASWGLLQMKSVRESVAAATPLIVNLISPPAPEHVTPPVLRAAPMPRPDPVLAPVPVVAVQAEPTITPPPAAVQAGTQPATIEPERPTPVAAAAVPRPAPAPTPPPLLPPSAIEYLVLPDVVYPNASRRLNEQGLVIVAVLIDADGAPRQVQLAQSSGFERLDQAALAGVRRARFKPYIENGQPRAGWARIPIPFELAH